MNFLNPLILLAGLGIALPILAHLLNRTQVKTTDWAAMQFLNRSVRVRSRQLRLRDLLLLCLRCLALLLLVAGLSRPFLNQGAIGEQRGGVVIGLDASYSMGHSDGTSTRFERAVAQVEAIASELHPGDPLSLVLLGAEHQVVARNMAYRADDFDALLQAQKPQPESIDLDPLPRTLGELADALDAPQKSVYLLSDFQAQDWQDQPAWLSQAFAELGDKVTTTIVPVGTGDAENLALTDLEFVSGVLRKDSVARYRATVRNCGGTAVANVQVKGLVDDIPVDTKTIPAIAAGASETVSLFFQFQNPGPVRISAQLEPDALPIDDTRRTVAVIREAVSVLSVEGAPGAAGGFITAALRARGGGANTGTAAENFSVQAVAWNDLPAQDLDQFDVVILQDVPDITPEQARAFEATVRAGKGLIWFAGDRVDADAWNRRSALEGTALLPAVIGEPVRTSDALGVGRSLDPTLSEHPVCRPLRSLPEDLLSETRFRKVFQVTPAANSTTVLTLAGTEAPLLLEHALGRGQVFMFTTSADAAWNNLAVTPVFPMVLQQMVTYLTAREFETPRLVGDSLALSYVDQPDASEAVFEAPSGESNPVAVREHRGQHVALLEHAAEDGFYLARVSLQSPGQPIAVNVDPAESDVRCLDPSDIVSRFDALGLDVAASETELLDAVDRARPRRSLWFVLLLAGLALLVVESLLAMFMSRQAAGSSPLASSPEVST